MESVEGRVRDALVAERGLSRRQFIILVGVSGVATVMPITLFAASNPPDAPSHSTSTESLPMPLVCIDAYEGRSEAEIKVLLDSAHKAVVKALHINERDRYQIYNAHPRSHFIMQDTGLGIQRTDKALVITVKSKQRAEILKRRLYHEMTQELSRSAGIAPSDVMICVIENSAADWTFGNGEPQFLTGDLG